MFKWQPISSAPKGRKIIISWEPDPKYPDEEHGLHIVKWNGTHWADDRGETFDNDPFWAPTRWMELPAAAHIAPRQTDKET